MGRADGDGGWKALAITSRSIGKAGKNPGPGDEILG